MTQRTITITVYVDNSNHADKQKTVKLMDEYKRAHAMHSAVLDYCNHHGGCGGENATLFDESRMVVEAVDYRLLGSIGMMIPTGMESNVEVFIPEDKDEGFRW